MDYNTQKTSSKSLAEFPSNLNGRTRLYIDVLGRFILAFLFFISSFNHVKDWQATISLMQQRGLPYPNVFLVAAMVIELGAGGAFVLGWRPQLAALALAFFTIVATTLFHLQPQVEIEMHMFLKDMSIFGAFLCFAVRPWPTYQAH